MIQDLSSFKLPHGFRGRSAIVVQLWWIVQGTLFKCSPQFMYRWRNFILRLFGAKIGGSVLIRPTARIQYPWKLSIGDHSWIGDHVDLYSLGEIHIGNHVCISQRSYICAASHDYQKRDFDIFADPVHIGDETWLATDVYVAPGVTIGEKCVVGARSSVFKSLKPNGVYLGYPAKRIRDRC